MKTTRIEAATADAPRKPCALRYLLVGELPLAAVLIFCAGAFVAGQRSVHPRDKVAIAEKGAIVLESVLAQPDASKEDIETRLRRPILSVFKKYADQGYTVLDASKDEAGNLAVVAISPDALDITAELRQAVRDASGRPGAGAFANPASSSAGATR